MNQKQYKKHRVVSVLAFAETEFIANCDRKYDNEIILVNGEEEMCSHF